LKSMFSFIRDILITIFGERVGESLWVAPLAVNFTINFLWLIFKNIFKVTTQYQAAREAREEGGTGAFLGIETVLFLFSFLVTFFILISVNFYLEINDIPQAHFSLWVPSVTSIILGEIARIFTGFRRAGETGLDERQRQFSWYFFLTIFALFIFWAYMIFGEELMPFLENLNRFLL